MSDDRAQPGSTKRLGGQPSVHATANQAWSDAERQCLTSLAAGQDAWPEFWRLYSQILVYELGRLGIHAGALREDIFQDLACKLIRSEFKAIRQFLDHPPRASFSALLRVAVRNLALSHLRSRHFKRELLNTVDPAAIDLPAVNDWARDPALSLEEQQRFIGLLRHASGGEVDSAAYRALLLRFAGDESVNHIAQQLGISPNSASQRIKYYLARLRQMLGGNKEHGHD